MLRLHTILYIRNDRLQQSFVMVSSFFLRYGFMIAPNKQLLFWLTQEVKTEALQLN